jgi:serine/threonine-protein kinase
VAELGSVLGGRYRLDQVLGQGGMATIFRATDGQLGREVAVKVLRPEFGSDPQFVERFTREARAAASLSHPNIVQVYDYGTSPVGPYIVMEQVAGGDLSVALGEHGALPPTAVARTGQQIADALAAAHARGLVHRDIKPGNILLSPDGRVQVADFGIAQAAASSPVTATGITLGSVLYFSPEQARGDPSSPASDIYSLGLVMYELLTGQRAFSGDSPAAVAVARLSGGVPSPMTVRADMPPALDAIVRWCLATDPSARPSAQELSMALARFISDPAGAAALPNAASMQIVTGAAADGPGGLAPAQAVLLPANQAPATGPARSPTAPWTWIAAGLGLLVIVASGILLFLLFSGIGDPVPAPSLPTSPEPQIVRMPSLVGRPEVEAVRAAQRRGLVLETEYVESEEAAGRVVGQLPDPGVELPAGTAVQITVATHVETVVVPDVHGINETTAIEQLEAAGLEVGERSSAADRLPAGYVISTEPRAGDSATRGSRVDYIVSEGRSAPSTRPPGRTFGPAGSTVPSGETTSDEPSGVPVSSASAPTEPVVSTAASAVPTDPSSTPGVTIMEMTMVETPTATLATEAPPSESTARPGDSAMPSRAPSASRSTPVSSVSPSPFPSDQMAMVGDFLCLDLATARAHIEEAGLLIGVTIPSETEPADDWIVHGQLPKAGESVPVGTNVDLVLVDPLEPCPPG